MASSESLRQLPKEIAREQAEHDILLTTREERIQETLMGELKGLPFGRAVYAAHGGAGGGPGKVLFLTDKSRVQAAARDKLVELKKVKQEQADLLQRVS